MLGRNVWVRSDADMTKMRVRSRAVVLASMVPGALLVWVGVVMTVTLGLASFGTYLLFLPMAIYGLFVMVRGFGLGILLDSDGTVTEVGLFQSKPLRVIDIDRFRIDRDPIHPLPWHTVWVDDVEGSSWSIDKVKLMRFSSHSTAPLEDAVLMMNQFIDAVRSD